jgi:hypothetical protein
MCSLELRLTAAAFAAFLFLTARAMSADESPDLSALSLAPEASHEEIAAYLRSIMKASPDPEKNEGKTKPKEDEPKPKESPSPDNEASTLDPQIEMIAKVGPDNVVFVFEAMKKSTSYLFLDYAEKALKKLANDSNKKEFLSALIFLPSLISAISEKGWSAEAEPILLNRMTLASQAQVPLPKNWLFQIALLKKPEMDIQISSYLSSLADGGAFYLPEMMVELEEADFSKMPGPVAQAGWKIAEDVYARQSAKPVVKAYRQRMAYALAGRGNVDALQALADGLAMDFPDDLISWNKKKRLERLRKLTGAEVDADQFSSWIDARKKNLVFDQEKKIYRISDSKKD